MILNTLRIQTGRWQTSWLYTSTAKELNQMFIHEFHVLELQIEMSVYDSGSFIFSRALLTSGSSVKDLNMDSNPDLCDTSAV